MVRVNPRQPAGASCGGVLGQGWGWGEAPILPVSTFPCKSPHLGSASLAGPQLPMQMSFPANELPHLQAAARFQCQLFMRQGRGWGGVRGRCTLVRPSLPPPRPHSTVPGTQQPLISRCWEIRPHLTQTPAGAGQTWAFCCLPGAPACLEHETTVPACAGRGPVGTGGGVSRLSPACSAAAAVVSPLTCPRHGGATEPSGLAPGARDPDRLLPAQGPHHLYSCLF